MSEEEGCIYDDDKDYSENDVLMFDDDDYSEVISVKKMMMMSKL